MNEGGPTTERRNPKTHALDLLSIDAGVRLFAEIDGEIFRGAAGGTGLFAAADVLADLADRIAADLDGGRIDRVCFSGSGTSGRLCYIAALLAQRRWPAGPIRYNVNGGLGAYLRSRAGIEDDYHRGVAEVARLGDRERRTALIGVSCGLSAPYIAGQLGAAMDGITGHVAALGFNPPAMARAEVRGAGFRSFKSVLDEGSRRDDFTILTPDVGPEAIAGSVRLKAGTATMIVLGAIAARLASPTAQGRDIISVFFDQCEEAVAHVHRLNAGLARMLIGEIAERLRAGVRTHVVSRDLIGLMACADAAECPPTFGAGYEDLIGYCRADLFDETLSGGFDIGRIDAVPKRADLLSNTAAPVTPGDLAIVLGGRVPRPFAGAGTILNVDVTSTRNPAPRHPGPTLQLLGLPDFPEFFRALQFKVFVNTVSSLAFCQVGKIYGNVMIDLRISNAKLFDRSVAIVVAMCGCDKATARRALLRAIYAIDDVSAHEQATVLDHVAACAGREHVIAIAILLIAQPQLDVRSAIALAGEGRSIRQLTTLRGASPERSVA